MKYLPIALVLLTSAAHAQDPVIDFTGDDAKMNAAIGQARDSFDGFWQRVVGEDGISIDGASIKVAAPYGANSHEHIWMGPCKALDAPQFVCMVGNETVHVNAKLGDPFVFTRAQISDWMILRKDGKIEGAYTLRVMLPSLPKDQADGFREVLLPLPEK